MHSVHRPRATISTSEKPIESDDEWAKCPRKGTPAATDSKSNATEGWEGDKEARHPEVELMDVESRCDQQKLLVVTGQSDSSQEMPSLGSDATDSSSDEEELKIQYF